MAHRLHFWLFVAVLVLAPLPLGSNRPWSWSLLAALIGILCVTWPLVALSDEGTPTVHPKHVAVPLLGGVGVMAWTIIQAMSIWPLPTAMPLWSEAQTVLTAAASSPPLVTAPIATDLLTAPTMTMRLLCYVGVLWLALQHGRSARRSHRLIDALAVAGGVYAVYGLLVFALGNETILLMRKWAYPDALTATFVNRNTFATYAGLSLLCALTAIAYRLDPPMRWRTLVLHCARPTAIFALIAVALTAALIASGSRAGSGATLLGITALYHARQVLRHPPGPSRRTTLVRGAVWVAVLLMAAVSVLLWGRTLDGDFMDRQRVYGMTLDLIAERPWTGYGPGSFAAVFATVRPLELPHVWSEAHDTYLELAMELGIPATAVLVTATLWLFVVCLRGGMIRRRDGMYPLLGVAATILVGVHALFDFSLQIPGLTVTWTAILGVAVAQARRHEQLTPN